MSQQQVQQEEPPTAPSPPTLPTHPPFRIKNRTPITLYDQLVFEGTMASYEENKYKTLSCFNKAIQLEPRLHVAFLKRGIEYFNLSLKQKATEDFSRALECVKNFPEIQAFYPNDRMRKQMELILSGLISEVAGDTNGAFDFYQEACALHVFTPEYLEAELNDREAFEEEVRAHQLMLSSFNATAPNNNANATTTNNVNNNAVDQSLLENVKKELSVKYELKRIEEFEDDMYTSYAHFSLGFVQFSQKNYSAAAYSYKRSIAFGPMHSSCIHYNNLGYCFEHLQWMDEAYVEYWNAMKVHDRCLKSMFNIAKMLNQEYRRYDESMEMLERIRRIDPSQQDVWIEKGEIYLNKINLLEDAEKSVIQGLFREAETCFEKAIRIDPGSSLAYIRLASAGFFQVMRMADDYDPELSEERLREYFNTAMKQIMDRARNIMVDDQELTRLQVFEKMIADSLHISEQETTFNEEEVLHDIEQHNFTKILGDQFKYCPLEPKSCHLFKQALLCSTGETFYRSPMTVFSGSESEATNSPILRSPMTPNSGYDYYFQKYSNSSANNFVDVELFFQS